MDRLLAGYNAVKWLKHLALAAFLVLFIHHPAKAAEQISNFDSKVTVQQSGRVDVTETINYDFGYASRHGIYRYVPVVYTDDQGVTYKPGFGFDSVMVDGQPAKFSTSRDGDNEVIKIGDANKTITGAHAYTIKYHFDSLVLNKDGDLLRFNVTGSGWNVPIANASITLQGPATPKLACYTGYAGSTDKDCAVDEATGTITANDIAPGSDFTVEALWPSGTVAKLLMPYQRPLWHYILLIAAIVYALIGIGLVIAAIMRWLLISWAEYRARKRQLIIAEYEPPLGLTPAELGLLIDNQATLIEVTSTLIQSAVAGAIRISLIKEKTMFSAAEYSLTKLTDFKGVPIEDQRLLTAIFGSHNEIKLSDFDKTKVPEAIRQYQETLRQSLKTKRLYTNNSKFAKITTAAGLVIIALLALGPAAALAAILIVPLGMYSYKRAGQVPRRTPQGLKAWAHVEGFKLFLSVTEKERLAFTDAPARTPKQFSKFLPYAIALGVEKEWAKQFEGIDITRSTGWYDGRGQAFTAGYLVGSLSDSFAPAVATSTRAPSTTSSGGFGGGSSGGGFSGGGGGSW